MIRGSTLLSVKVASLPFPFWRYSWARLTWRRIQSALFSGASYWGFECSRGALRVCGRGSVLSEPFPGPGGRGQWPIPTSPELWAARQRPSPPEEIKVCQYESGELCWSATVPGPDICSRPARIAARVNSLQCGDICRISEAAGYSFEIRLPAQSPYASPRWSRRTNEGLRGGKAPRYNVSRRAVGCSLWKSVP